MEKLVAKGAEADLYLIEWNGLKAIKKLKSKKKAYQKTDKIKETQP